MTAVAEVLAQLSVQHLLAIRSEERDGRLIFPGLTPALAQELHERVSLAVASTRLGESTPVYLALDYPQSELSPDPTRRWLHYEAVTSMRSGSFVAVCMPKVLPKLHDSISGSGSPVRALAFGDEWPWRDGGAEAFRFKGPFLAALLSRWGVPPASRDWLEELVVGALISGTAPLRDSVRVPLLLESILGVFSPGDYLEFDDIVDKFLFHCGLPCRTPGSAPSVRDYTDAVRRAARALEDLRSKNPEFRSYLVDEVAPSRFAARSDLPTLRDALHLLLDGCLELGVESGVLAFRGGLGQTTPVPFADHWRTLDLGTLEQLLGVGQADQVSARLGLPAGRGVLSLDRKQAAVFQGTVVEVAITAEVPPDRFTPGEFTVRCRRRTRDLREIPCTNPTTTVTVEIPATELPPGKSRVSLSLQLLRLGQVSSETRVYVHVCGGPRPAIAILEPGFTVVDLLELDEEADSDDSESLVHGCTDPVTIHILDSQATSPCEVLVDDEPVDLHEVESSDEHETDGWVRAEVDSAIDVERFSGGRADVTVLASGYGREVTLEGVSVEPGEFTLEDEFRVAIAVGPRRRLARVAPLFIGGDGPRSLPPLGNVDGPARWRMDAARLLEDEEHGWKPMLLDFVGNPGAINALQGQEYWRARETLPTLLAETHLPTATAAALEVYRARRSSLLRTAAQYAASYSTAPERPFYVTCPQYVDDQRAGYEAATIDYVSAYTDLLLALGSRDHRLSPAGMLLIQSLDCVVLLREAGRDRGLDFGVRLVGPWHPLVVAKRFMVQYWLHHAASGEGRLPARYLHLASLFDRVDGFRSLPGFDGDSLTPDVGFAFPSSDPGWHIALSAHAFAALPGTHFLTPRGLGEAVRSSTGLQSPLYLAGSELWNASFIRSFQRAHPSRRQLGLRLSDGLDPEPVADSCEVMLRKHLGEFLPGGVHLYLAGRFEDREPLSSDEPRVFVYEGLDDGACYDRFQPDILFLPQREEWRPGRLAGWDEQPAVPRGSGNAAAFFLPLVELSENRDGVPLSKLIESGEVAPVADDAVAASVGGAFANALRHIDLLAQDVQPQRPVLVQELGLPGELRCDWTVLAGSQVDVGALASYVASDRARLETRALWDYRLDLGRSLSSYFIVSRVPRTVVAALAGNPFDSSPEAASAMVRDLAEAGFAVGETMRSGKAAVGVIGVVGALRLLRAAWRAGGSGTRRWTTLFIPVDCFTGFLVPPRQGGGGQKRTDLLCIHVAWTVGEIADPDLSLSWCAVESKYVAGQFPPSAVGDALAQAAATFAVFAELAGLAQAETGMAPRLALVQLVRFGLRLLACREDAQLADEALILRQLLNGEFRVVPALAPTLLVSTSAGDEGDASIDPRNDGWWTNLTRTSWPRGVPDPADKLVAQLSPVFAENSPLSSDGSEAVPRGGIPPTPTRPGGGTSSFGVPGTPSAMSDDSHSGQPEQPPTSPPTGGQTAEPVPVPVPVPGDGLDVDQADATVGDGAEPDGRTKVGPRGPEGEEETAGEPPEVGNADPVSADRPSRRVHEVFEGFIGNEQAVEALTILLDYARARGRRAISSVGLFGPKSTGKTELARRMARALQVPHLELSETGLGDIDQLADRMQEKAREAGTPMTVAGQDGGLPVLTAPPMLVFIDEVHQLKARVQDMLLPVLEADDRTLRGSRVIINARQVSFAIATTDWGRLREAFLSRVRSIPLRPYTLDEVAAMLRHRVDALARGELDSLDIDPAVVRLEPEALLAVSTAARAVPRVALDRLKDLGMALALGRHGPTTEEVWQHLQRLVPCDRNGLSPIDRRYLRALRDDAPAGLGNIATQLGTDKANVEGAIEPYLVQRGWVRRGASGRSLTPEGRALLSQLIAAGDA